MSLSGRAGEQVGESLVVGGEKRAKERELSESCRAAIRGWSLVSHTSMLLLVSADVNSKNSTVCRSGYGARHGQHQQHSPTHSLAPPSQASLTNTRRPQRHSRQISTKFAKLATRAGPRRLETTLASFAKLSRRILAVGPGGTSSAAVISRPCYPFLPISLYRTAWPRRRLAERACKRPAIAAW